MAPIVDAREARERRGQRQDPARTSPESSGPASCVASRDGRTARRRRGFLAATARGGLVLLLAVATLVCGPYGGLSLPVVADDALPGDTLPSSPPPPTVPGNGSFLVSEPNDGELLGVLLSMHYTVLDSEGAVVSVYVNGSRIAQALVQVDPVLICGTATVRIDTSQLPNGPATLESRLLATDGTIIDTHLRTVEISHPECGVVETEVVGGQVASAVLSINVPEAAESTGATVPYVVLASRSSGSGAFPAYGLDLAMPPASTSVIASGALAFAADGSTTLTITAPDAASGTNPTLRVQVLIFQDGEWAAGTALVIAAP